MKKLNTMKKLNKFQLSIARSIEAKIQESTAWVARQEIIVDDAVLGSNTTGYDLRQSLQALNTGRLGITLLVEKFEECVGVSYSDYCAEYSKEEIQTPENQVVRAVKAMIEEMLNK